MSFFFVRQDEQEELDDLRTVLKSHQGRRVIRRLLNTGRLMEEGGTEHIEGKREIALWLARRIERASPGELARLMQESSNDRLAATAKPKTRSKYE